MLNKANYIKSSEWFRILRFYSNTISTEGLTGLIFISLSLRVWEAQTGPSHSHHATNWVLHWSAVEDVWLQWSLSATRQHPWESPLQKDHLSWNIEYPILLQTTVCFKKKSHPKWLTLLTVREESLPFLPGSCGSLALQWWDVFDEYFSF